MATLLHLVLFLACLAVSLGVMVEPSPPSCLHDPPEKFQNTSGNGKYFFIDTSQKLTFLEAREECWKQGGHDLAMLHTFQDYQVLTQLASDLNVDECYIGLLDVLGENCQGNGATDCNSQLRWLDGKAFSYEGSSFHQNDLFKIDKANDRSIRLYKGSFRDASGQEKDFNFACEFNCNDDLPPNLEPGVQKFGSVLVKIHYNFDPTQAGDPCPSNSQLFEPRDESTIEALETLLAIIDQEVVIGMKYTGILDCNFIHCNSRLTFLSDGTVGFFSQEQFADPNLIGGQATVKASFDFSSNLIKFETTEEQGLPFLCQINDQPQCSSMDDSTIDQRQHQIIDSTENFVRYSKD